MSKNIFVFGSNTAGRHGKGAAKFALENCGAVYGQAVGLQGNSYAIPTRIAAKTGPITKNVPPKDIEAYVNVFLKFAEDNPDLQFQLTNIGCGLAGYTIPDIAPMFIGKCSANIRLTKEFRDFANESLYYTDTANLKRRNHVRVYGSDCQD